MRNCILITLLSMLTQFGWAQITYIPDDQFEGKLILQGIDTDGILNGQVWTADIEDEVFLDLSDVPLLQDLTGIEDFASLEEFILFRADVSQIDLSHNLNLKDLKLDDLSLESLDLSQNIFLEKLSISLNSPTGMFTSEFDFIDVTMLSELQQIIVVFTQITSINLSINDNLEWVTLKYMPSLEQANVQNGNNENIYWLEINESPNVQCIQVDDPIAVLEGNPPYDSWFFDDPDTISDNCFVLGSEENMQSNIIIYPNPTSNILTIQNQNGLDIESVVLCDTLGRKVMESNESTESLDVSNLTAGIYFIHITTDQGLVTKRIIKK